MFLARKGVPDLIMDKRIETIILLVLLIVAIILGLLTIGLAAMFGMSI